MVANENIPSLQTRYYSSGGRKGFISGFVENIKQELAKNKEMKESIKKFREEAKKLEESDALQEARRKYVSLLPFHEGQNFFFPPPLSLKTWCRLQKY